MSLNRETFYQIILQGCSHTPEYLPYEQVWINYLEIKK